MVDREAGRSLIGITRREALMAGAAAASVAMTPSLLGAQTPKRGGNVRVASDSSASNDNLDPRTYVNNFPTYAGYFWGNLLFHISPEGKLYNELAESFDVEPGAKKWVIKLRKGVQFHNGKTLTASDVVYSINRHRAPEALSGLRPTLDQIAELKATGPEEVTFELKAGNADWLYVLTDRTLLIQAEGAATDKGIGTGPYIPDNFQPGVRLTMKRNPNYWRNGQPYFDTVELLAINDTQARITALGAGDVDIALALQPRAAPLLEARGLNILRTPSTAYTYYACHTKEAPFTSNDMRLALKYGIDRKEMVERIQAGSGDIANDHFIPRFLRYHAAGLAQKTYDPDKAKFHYQKTGHSGPLRLTVPQSMAGGVEQAELYQQQLRRAGIDMQIERVPDEGYYGTVWNKRPFFAAAANGRVNEDTLVALFYVEKSVYNDMQWSHPRIDELMLAARSELDEAKRKQQYYEIQELVSMEAGHIVPYFLTKTIGYSKKIQGLKVGPTYDGRFIENIYSS